MQQEKHISNHDKNILDVVKIQNKFLQGRGGGRSGKRAWYAIKLKSTYKEISIDGFRVIHVANQPNDSARFEMTPFHVDHSSTITDQRFERILRG